MARKTPSTGPGSGNRDSESGIREQPVDSCRKWILFSPANVKGDVVMLQWQCMDIPAHAGWAKGPGVFRPGGAGLPVSCLLYTSLACLRSAVAARMSPIHGNRKKTEDDLLSFQGMGAQGR